MKHILCFFIVLCFMSCGLGTKIEDATTKAVNAIDEAISNLSFESEEWRTVLEGALDKIPDEIKEIIGNDMQNLINESIAVTGVELRCNVDFFRARLRQDLGNIKRKILKQTLIIGDAEICQTVPGVIDLNLSPNDRNSIIFTGYDLRNSEVRLFLLSGGIQKDYTSKLSKTSNYQLTANLGGNGIPLNSNSSKIILKYKNNTLSEIPVIQVAPEICESKAVRTSSKKHTLVPVKTRGDREFDGNGPRITCWVKLNLSQDKKNLRAEMYMKAKETKSDWSTAEKTETITLYNAPNNWIIEKISTTPTSNYKAYLDDDHALDTYNIGEGPVQKMVFTGDLSGNDIGRTQVEILFRPISLQLKENKDCVVSRFTLATAINKGVVSNKLRDGVFEAQPLMRTVVNQLAQ